MQQIITNLPLIKLVGITAYTNNEAEMTKEGKIGPTIQKYFGENLPSKIKNRKNPGRTFCIYTNYEGDHTGNYKYFVGEEVTDFDGIEEGFENLVINNQTYVKFTTESGPMPEICINAWQKIWNMNDSDFGGERAYIADFEIYDERSLDPQNTILDIWHC